MIPAMDHPTVSPVGRSLLATLLLVLLFTAQPGAYLPGNWDPGVYLGHGALIDRHGLVMSAPDAAASLLTVTQTALLYPEYHGATIKTPGFFSPGPPFGTLLPQFLPGYPLALGAAFALGGLPAALRLDALLVALAVVILARWAERRTAAPPAFWCTVALIGLHPVTIWFARFHTAESLALLLGAWWLTGLCPAPAAQPTSRLLHLARIVPPIAMSWTTPATWPLVLGSSLFALAPGSSTGARLTTALTALAGPASAALTLLALDHPYARHLLTVTPPLRQYLILGTFMAGSVALLLAITHRVATRCSARTRSPRPATTALCTALLIALTAAAPYLAPPFADGLLVLTPLALWVVAAPGFLSHDPRDRFRQTVLFALTAALTIYFLLAPAMPALYPWTWKRWWWWTLPVVSAAAAVAIATRASRAAPTFRHRVAIPAATTAALLLLPWLWCAPIATTTAWRGLPAWMATLSASLPPDAIVLADKTLAAPLEFLHGHPVVPLYADDTATTRTPHYLDLLAAHPDRTFALVATTPPPPWWPAARALPVALTPYEGHWIKPQPAPFGFIRESRRFDPVVSLLPPTSAP